MGGKIFFHKASNNCLTGMCTFLYFPCQTKIYVHYSQASRKRLLAAYANGQSLLLFLKIDLHH